MMTILTNQSRGKPMTMIDDGLGIPEELRVANRKPLTPEQEQKLAVMAAGAVTVTKASAAVPNPKGSSPVPGKSRKVPQLPLPRKGANLPTPRAPRPVKPGSPTQAAPKPNPAPTGAPGPNTPKPEETIVSKKTKKTTAKAKTAAKKTPVRVQAPKGAAKAGNGGVRPGSKLEGVVGLLTRKEGCTTAQILELTGWPAVSVPQMAKSAGLTLRKEKTKGEPTRYWAS